MELLKRFEQEQVEEEEEDSDSELAERLQTARLDSAEGLWEALTEEQRKRFLEVVRDPARAQELASRVDTVLPWWESEGAPRPELLTLPKGTAPGIHLLYNICLILMAYAYTIRSLGVSMLTSEKQEAIKLISHLVPFLVTQGSKEHLTSLDQAVTSFCSSADPDALPAILKDAAILLRPLYIRDVNAESPFLLALAALSDLHSLFSHKKSVAHKIRFYAASVSSMPTDLGEGVVRQLEQREKIESEERMPPKEKRIIEDIHVSKT